MLKRAVTNLVPFTELPTAGPYDATNKLGNYDLSRSTIDRIILHTSVGTWQAAAARFNDLHSNVSAHYGIRMDGSLIHWLEEYYTAYAAGDYLMNQRSISIEHIDNNYYNGVRPDILYHSSALLVANICRYYNIPIDRRHILKHSEVSDAPTGCPDALDVERIVREAILVPIPIPPPTPTPPPVNTNLAAFAIGTKQIALGSGFSWQKVTQIKALITKYRI